MRSPNFMRRPPVITQLSADYAEQLAKLHALCFPHGWDSAAFRSFLADSRALCFGARKSGKGQKTQNLSGFILARLISGEAEILTFAVAPAARRSGLGRALLEHLLRVLYHERAEALFLEVEEGNAAARALYRKCRLTETGRRKGYYAAEQDALRRADAILLEYRFKQADYAAREPELCGKQGLRAESKG